MGRWPEINHTQLQGQQRQSNDMPQETVSFVYITHCSWLLASKWSYCQMILSIWPGNILLTFPSMFLTLKKTLTDIYLYSYVTWQGRCDKFTNQKLYEKKGWWQEDAGTSGSASSVLWVVGTGFCVPTLSPLILLCAPGAVVEYCCSWSLCWVRLRNAECEQKTHLQQHPLLGFLREHWPQGVLSTQSGGPKGTFEIQKGLSWLTISQIQRGIMW